MLLFTFVKKNRNKKCMVFFSTCNAVKYHAELFNYVDIPVKDIHVSVSLSLSLSLHLSVRIILITIAENYFKDGSGCLFINIVSFVG